MTRKEGFINLDQLLQEIGVDTTSLDTILQSPMIELIAGKSPAKFNLSFIYENKVYYYKYNRSSLPYNELVAEELLNDYGLLSAHYDLAQVEVYKGVISRSFKSENTMYINGDKLLENCYKKDDAPFLTDHYNNLEGIWDALVYRYCHHPRKKEIISKLMKKIVDMFIFDILCNNYDRHGGNWGILESKDNVDLAPIFDNDGILGIKRFNYEKVLNHNLCIDNESFSEFSNFNSKSLNENEKNSTVLLTVDENIFENLWNTLKKFRKISSSEFRNLILEKLWIISDYNIKLVLGRVENKIGYLLPDEVKNYYLENFSYHRKMLEEFLKEEIDKERDEYYERKN